MLPKILLISCLICACSSCKFVVRKMYGIYNPRIESTKSVERYATKHGIQSPFYVYRDSATAMKELSSLGLPEAYFYTKEGYFIEYKESPEACNAGVDKFIHNIATLPRVPDTTRTLQRQLTTLVHPHTRQPVLWKDLPQADYYILANWATWIGKANHIQSWQKAIENVRTKGINIILVPICADFQDFWGMQPIKKTSFKAKTD